jgi:hypothetical protein
LVGFALQDGQLILSNAEAAQFLSLTDMLIYSVTQHAMFSRNYFMNHDILKPLSKMLKSNLLHLRLGTID